MSGRAARGVLGGGGGGERVQGRGGSGRMGPRGVARCPGLGGSFSPRGAGCRGGRRVTRGSECGRDGRYRRGSSSGPCPEPRREREHVDAWVSTSVLSG